MKMSGNIEKKIEILPIATGVVLSIVFIIIDSFLITNFLASLIAGFLSKKPILFSIIYGALIGIIISLILYLTLGSCPGWAELIGKGIVGAIIGNVIGSKINK